MPVSWREGFQDTPGGRLYWQAWTPPSPRAALLLVHGLAEHSGRYVHVARYFAGRAYASVAVDLRGHGRSPGPRVHVDSFEPWCDDVAEALRLTRALHPGLPVVPIGHSQGGLVTLLQGLRDPDERPGTVVSSPLLGVAPPSRPNAALKLATKILMRVAPRLLVPNRVNPDWLSRDPEVGRAYQADPLVSHQVSAGWFRALQGAIARAHGGAEAWTTPLLVLASRGDRIVDAEATRRWVARAPAGLVESRFFDDLHHEIFNERGKEAVLDVVAGWLDDRLSAG